MFQRKLFLLGKRIKLKSLTFFIKEIDKYYQMTQKNKS